MKVQVEKFNFEAVVISLDMKMRIILEALVRQSTVETWKLLFSEASSNKKVN